MITLINYMLWFKVENWDIKQVKNNHFQCFAPGQENLITTDGELPKIGARVFNYKIVDKLYQKRNIFSKLLKRL